jgi:hypothetical protein
VKASGRITGAAKGGRSRPAAKGGRSDLRKRSRERDVGAATPDGVAAVAEVNAVGGTNGDGSVNACGTCDGLGLVEADGGGWRPCPTCRPLGWGPLHMRSRDILRLVDVGEP